MFSLAKDFSLQIGKIALIATTVIVAVFVVLAFLRFGFIFWIYSSVEDWTTVRLGFDYYLAQLAATAFSAVFSFLLPTLAWYILLGKKQAWGIGIIVGVQVLMCVSIYTLGSGVCFDRRTGKPLCFYADTPTGRIWSRTPGFDPESGQVFQIYTREIKDMEDRQKSKTNPLHPSAANQMSIKPNKIPK